MIDVHVVNKKKQRKYIDSNVHAIKKRKTKKVHRFLQYGRKK